MMRLRIIMLIGTTLGLLLACGKKDTSGFRLLGASETGIDFENTIKENDSINVFEFMNIYTGAGVAVGDINNDGMPDVYFSGNMVSGRMYLNKGDLQFEDVTESAGLLDFRWGTGVTMVDINSDGWLDLYVCVSGSAAESERANLLYINNGDMTFTEKAKEFGLADTRQSMQAAFFDYDNDQDLDMYLLVNQAAYEYRVNSSTPRQLKGQSVSNDRLYRNDGNNHFTDVTLQAGILVEGYGLGVGISDIDEDGWPDIYVSNDFIGNDILYINQGNGTFKDRIMDYLNHTSYAGMGNDIADFDNNGKPDIMVLDMRPEDNERQKLIISSTGYDRFNMMLDAGYQPQYSRNTLQLNKGGGEFSEIGFLAGVSSTDWSWSPLLADFDNDGYRDMFVSNGFLRDLGNLDYIHYQNIYDNPLGDADAKIKKKLESIADLPSARLQNYLYKNKGDTTFKNVTEEWGMEVPSCSNGAAYADLDNDGDLDLVVNNVNQSAFLYENLSERDSAANYVSLVFKGDAANTFGIGSKIKITTGSKSQVSEQFLSRGYESSIDPVMHFGLGMHKKIDSLEVRWPDGRYQLLTEVPSNRQITLVQANAKKIAAPPKPQPGTTWLQDITDSLGVSFRHTEDAVADFKLQPILPHMHSRLGPGIAVADVDGDHREDFYVGGAARQNGQLYIQQQNGTFEIREWPLDAEFEDMGTLFFDADKDGDQDLYVVSGGVFLNADLSAYQDRLYLNDGKGNFEQAEGLPDLSASGSVVTATDFDRDGDLDLFIGGRVSPGAYPMAAKSRLLENHGLPGAKPEFRDISDTVLGWDQLRMVTSALWTDYDNDGWTDLIACGEFMPIVLFHNNKGKLEVVPPEISGLIKSEGWWNSINGGDLDNDGDTDYILGNLGWNSKYVASPEEPLCIYASDYDKNGRVDPVMCYFIQGRNYMAHSRDELIGQINAMRSRFKTYQSFAETTFEKSFRPEELRDAYVVKSYNFASSYLQNLGDGRFHLQDLPAECQVGPLEGIVMEDMDQDGNLDVFITGNSYATEVTSGRYDAVKGIVLKGDGRGGLTPLSLEKTGFLNDLDGSGLALLRNPLGSSYLIAASNDGPLRIFGDGNQYRTVTPGLECQSLEILLKDNRSYKKECYLGSGYLSQGTRSIVIHDGIKEVRTTDTDGSTKTIYLAN